MNRTVFGFNDKLNSYALRPLAHGYAIVVPLKVRTSITNFFDNLQFPVRFVNSVLQGKLTRSAQETGKFVVNSTAGIGGLFRVSDHIAAIADVPAEDFGQTLGFWGIPPGPYLVIPVLGPSDCRDLVGFVGDYAASPLNWHTLGIIHCAYISDAASIALSATRYVNGLPKAIETYDQLKSEAVDPYVAVRDAYLSYRAAQVKK
jgi:phospholipid-binding lipoprotein MlaA